MDGGSSARAMNGADVIVEYLVRQKVPYLFGLCGHGNVGFLDAAFKAQNRIRTVSVHHEQTAGHMADAYFKVLQGAARTGGDLHELRAGLGQPGGRAGGCDDGQQRLPTSPASSAPTSSAAGNRRAPTWCH